MTERRLVPRYADVPFEFDLPDGAAISAIAYNASLRAAWFPRTLEASLLGPTTGTFRRKGCTFKIKDAQVVAFQRPGGTLVQYEAVQVDLPPAGHEIAFVTQELKMLWDRQKQLDAKNKNIVASVIQLTRLCSFLPQLPLALSASWVLGSPECGASVAYGSQSLRGFIVIVPFGHTGAIFSSESSVLGRSRRFEGS